MIIINLIAIIITAHDKSAAITHRRRVPERVLMFVSAIGGAPAMYLTMIVIRHKTRKPLFMIGIPLIFLLEASIFLIGAHYVLYII